MITPTVRWMVGVTAIGAFNHKYDIRDETVAWFTGSVALAVMLAILAIDPNQLAAINGAISYQRWQALSHVLICSAVIAWLAAYFGARFQSNLKPPYPTQTPVYISPFYVVKQQGALVLLVKGTALLLFWLALMSQSLAQRIQAIEQSPSQTWYVEATVTPIGLSDKRLEVAYADYSNDANMSTSSRNKTPSTVEEGYRQLVRLTDITRYKRGEPSASNHDNTTANPFVQDIGLSEEQVGLSDNEAALKLPKQMTVMLQSYQAKDDWLNEFSADKTARLSLTLSPIELSDNPDDFDEYRWLSSRHATAKAVLMTGQGVNQSVQLLKNSTPDMAQWINQQRFELRQRFLQRISLQPKQTLVEIRADGSFDDNAGVYPAKREAIAVTLSLLTGDRSLISRETTGLYRFAGISHLLAISGTHVLFLALLCAAMVTAVINRFRPRIYEWLPRWHCSFIIAVVVAFMYAAFAGFDVPAVRTACMLLMVGVLRYFLAVSATFKMLLALAVAMAWWDVFVLWQAGFWLSFVAVAVLFVYTQRWGANRQSALRGVITLSASVVKSAVKERTINQQIKRRIIELIKLQLWVSIALLPISLWLFGKISLWGFVVNLFAIGLFGWVIVPLNLLAGVVYLLSPALADQLWSLLFWLLSCLHQGLLWLQTTANQIGWVYTDMTLPIMLLMLLIALPWMLPQGVLSRLLCVPVLLLIGLSGMLPIKNSASSLAIIPLNTKDNDYFAVLLSSQTDSWLLLSAYSSEYSQNKMYLTSARLSAKNQALSLALYEQLKKQGIDNLTGVIVQTAIPKLSAVVAHLRQSMPISYYWQAGLKTQEADIAKAMQGLQLNAQDCTAGQRWQASDLTQTGMPSLSITAVTGWSVAKDNTMADCTLLLDTPSAITVLDSQKRAQTIASNYLHDSTALSKNSSYNRAIIYTSNQPQLAALWQLQCSIDMKYQPWVTSAHAQIYDAAIEGMHPISWHIIDEHLIPVNSRLKQTHLSWQQSIKSIVEQY